MGTHGTMEPYILGMFRHSALCTLLDVVLIGSILKNSFYQRNSPATIRQISCGMHEYNRHDDDAMKQYTFCRFPTKKFDASQAQAVSRRVRIDTVMS